MCHDLATHVVWTVYIEDSSVCGYHQEFVIKNNEGECLTRTLSAKITAYVRGYP